MNPLKIIILLSQLLLIYCQQDCTQSGQLHVQVGCEKKSMELYDRFAAWRKENYEAVGKAKIQTFRNDLREHKNCYSVLNSCSSLNGTVSKAVENFKLRYKHWENRVDFYLNSFASCIPKVMKMFDTAHCFSYFHENWNKKTSAQRCSFFDKYETCVKDWVAEQCGESMKNAIIEHIVLEKKVDECK